MSFDDLYPADFQSANNHEDGSGTVVAGNFQICGKDVPRGYWVGSIISFLFCSLVNGEILMFVNCEADGYFCFWVK